MAEEQKTRRTFDLPFTDFDYEAALPKYNLFGTRRSPRKLTVVGYESDIEKFAIDFGWA